VRPVEPGQTLSFAYTITIVDGDTGPAAAAEIAAESLALVGART